MSELQLISLVGSLAVIAYLVIGYRTFREPRNKTLKFAGIWFAVFAGAVLLISWLES